MSRVKNYRNYRCVSLPQCVQLYRSFVGTLCSVLTSNLLVSPIHCVGFTETPTHENYQMQRSEAHPREVPPKPLPLSSEPGPKESTRRSFSVVQSHRYTSYDYLGDRLHKNRNSQKEFRGFLCQFNSTISSERSFK